MFEFTTQTILSSFTANKDYVANTTNHVLRIGNLTLKKDRTKITANYKKHSKGHLAKVTFDLSDLSDTKTGTYRLALYLGLNMNSQDSFYANDLVYKGKPVYVEFDYTGDAEKAAAKLKSNANKYLLFTAQEKFLTVSVDNDTKVTIEGVDPMQIITKAAIQWFNPEAYKIDCCTDGGAFEDVIVGLPLTWEINSDSREVVPGETVFADGKVRALGTGEVGIEPGVEAFGDFDWMIHNLRLPTLDNTSFWSVNRNERPVPGTMYDQINITLCHERDGVDGGMVGERATSVTVHVLYVPTALTSTVIGALADVVEGGSVTLVNTDDEPFANAPEEEAEEAEEQGNG